MKTYVRVGRFRFHESAATQEIDGVAYDAELLAPGDLVISRTGQKATVTESRRVSGVHQYKINGQWVSAEEVGNSDEKHKPWRRYLSRPEAEDGARIVTNRDSMPERLRAYSRFLARHYGQRP